MKKIILILMVAGVFSASADAASVEHLTVFTTGKDWTEHMTAREKYIAVLAPMAVFHRYGVPFRLTVEGYLPRIDKVLKRNPQLLEEDVANILASTVYALEPESRPVFDELETRFLRGEYYVGGDFDLRIHPILE